MIEHIGRVIELAGKSYRYREYGLGKKPEGPPITPGDMTTPSEAEIMKRYAGSERDRERHCCIDLDMDEDFAVPVPYTFCKFGRDPTGGPCDIAEQFRAAQVLITAQPFEPFPPEIADLWAHARAVNPKVFKKDTTVACLRKFEIDDDGHWVVTVGPGKYSDSFYSNGAEGIAYQGGTIGDVLFKKFGGLPDFDLGVHNNSIGTAGMLLTKDGEFIFVQRGGNVSVNKGVNCTASGAAEFDEELLRKYGFGPYLGHEFEREVNGELGLSVGTLVAGSMRWQIARELGLHREEYTFRPVGFIREILRGGKPEMMFLITTSLTTDEVVARIQANTNVEKNELEKSVISIPMEDIVDMFRCRVIGQWVQHKGVANLALALTALGL